MGRRAELQRIGDAIRVGAGVVLAGAPGVGKTRLAAEALAAADPRRYLGLWAAASADTATTPLGALGPLLPGGATAGDAAAQLRAATEALTGRGGARTLILGLDDAHLLDDLSAILVHQLVRTRKAVVLSTVLSRQRVPDPITALWKNELAGRFDVEPLGLDTVTDALVAALDGQVDSATVRRMWRTVRGSMALLRVLVDAGVDSGTLRERDGVWRWEGPWVLTPRLVAMVCERIGGLPADQQDVLEILAYGEPVGADLLTALAGGRAVEAVEARNLLAVHQDGRRVEIRLRQPLHGEVLRAGCPPERADRWRRLLADAVQATGARRPGDRMRIATWRLDAGLPVDPAALVGAAGEAYAALDLPLAERLARAALAPPETSAAEMSGAEVSGAEVGGAGSAPADPRLTVAAAAVLWRVLLLSQRSAEAEAMLTGLARLPPVEALPDDERVELAVGRAHHLFCGLSRAGEAFDVLAAARTRVGDAERRDGIDLLCCLFQVLCAEVAPAWRTLTALSRRPLGARPAAALPAVRGMALLHIGRLARARQALDVIEATDDLPWLAELRDLCRCSAALFAGGLPEAALLAAAWYEHAAERGWEFAMRLACGVLAQVARLRGRVHTAARWAREGARMPAGPSGGPLRHHVLAELAHAEALSGHAAAAEAALREAERHPPVSETFLRSWVELAQPWVAVAAGDREHAVDLAVAAARAARDRGAVVFEAFGLHDAARLGAAPAVLGRLGELAGLVDGDLVGTFAEHAAAAADGDAARLELVAARFADTGAHLYAAEAYAQAAHAHRRHGAETSERSARTRAALLLDNCEGAGTPLVAGIEAPALTRRERDIAALAAAGLSNQDIAQRLTLSRRTVGNHLHHVYGKLGVGDRGALAALVPALRPPP